ncbi:hypothetical protein OROMI_016602 [Orobanche minor]
MQSFLNKLSQNRRNLGAFYDFILSFWVSIFVNKKLFQNRSNFYNNIPTYDIRLFLQSFSNELSPNGRNLSVFLRFYNYFLGQIFVIKKLFQSRSNFYNNVPTCDIQLFMQSLSNELSPNSRNLGVFLRFNSYFLGPNFHNKKIVSESHEFLQQYLYM